KGRRQLDQSQVLRIVRAAALRAGTKKKVSPHWLRHAHASHSLDRGAPIHLYKLLLATHQSQQPLFANPIDNYSVKRVIWSSRPALLTVQNGGGIPQNLTRKKAGFPRCIW